MWTKAPRDPVDRAGLADKVGGEAWQLRKLRQNVEQLTESLSKGGSQNNAYASLVLTIHAVA